MSYYVEALWFGSLGYGEVFRKTLSFQWGVFAVFFAVTFFVLYGWFLALRRAYQPDLLSGGIIYIARQPVKLPIERILRLIALIIALLIAAAAGAGMMAEWRTFALYWHAPRTSGGLADPIFGKSLHFYLFVLPAWQLVTGWLLTLAAIACGVAVFFILLTGSARVFTGQRGSPIPLPWRGFSISFSFLLLILAMQVYLSRFEALFEEHTIFSGVTYTDAHVILTGLLIVCGALILGAAIAVMNIVSAPRVRWLLASIAPAIVCYAAIQVIGWYVGNFVVKPNELVREQPYIAHNIELTRQAYGLDGIA